MWPTVAAKITTRPDPVEVFARCAARAHLWAEGDIADLHEAIDQLQHDAARNGLVAKLGQDALQAITAMRGRPVLAMVPEPAAVVLAAPTGCLPGADDGCTRRADTRELIGVSSLPIPAFAPPTSSAATSRPGARSA